MEKELNYNHVYLIDMVADMDGDDNLGCLLDSLKLAKRFKLFGFLINPPFTFFLFILMQNVPLPIYFTYLILSIFLIYRIGVDIHENGLVIQKLFFKHTYYFKDLKQIRPKFMEEVKAGGCKMIYEIRTGQISHINYILIPNKGEEFLIDFEKFEKDSIVRFLKALDLKENPHIQNFRQVPSPFDL